MNKKELKATQIIEYVAKVMHALEDAHVAAREAYHALRAEMEADGEDGIPGPCGFAYVYVRSPSYRFRKALMDLGELKRMERSEWRISDFERCAWEHREQSIYAHKYPCRAAAAVLQGRFPEEKCIAVYAWKD